MIKISNDGDDHISPFQHKLWDFTYDVLRKFSCPIQFKVDGPNVPQKLDQIITFFVPENRQDVVEYIIKEWKDEIRETKDDENWFWGTYIYIRYFRGTEIYTEREIIKGYSQNLMMYLTAKINGADVDISDFTDIDDKKIH